MKVTKKAKAMIDSLGKYYDASVLAPVVERAKEIARRRKSLRLGHNHLHMALGELVNEG